MKKTILTLLTTLFVFCVYSQKLTVGKNSIQILDKMSRVGGTLYTVVYKADNSLLSNEKVIADAKAMYPINVYSKNITTVSDTSSFSIICKVANNATSIPVNYWVSYVYEDQCQGISLRLSSKIEVTRRQTDESFLCKSYVKSGVLEAPFKINYLMYAPESYYHSDKKYPIVISCHGNGQKGTNKLSLLRGTFLPQKLESTAFNVDFIVINPQTNGSKPAWNNAGWFKEMMDSLSIKYRVDTTEVYLLGYSGGGEGVSTYVKNFYVSGIGTFAPVITMTQVEKCKLVNKKIWGYHCLNDGTISPNITRNLIVDVNKCLPTTTIKPRSTYYTTGGHQPFDQAFRTDSLFQFFLGNIK